MKDDRLRAVYQSILARRPEGRAACPGPERLRELVELGGREATRLATLDHVMSCASCKEEYDLLSAIEAESPARQQSQPAVWRLATAAIALLAVGGGVYWSLRDPGDEPIRGGPRSLVTISPAGTIATTPTITLVWQAVEGAVGYRAEVLDAGGGVIFAAPTTDTTLDLPGTVSLAPGNVYRWWVSAELTDGTVLRSELREFLPR
jgi:hypothetical protein